MNELALIAGMSLVTILIRYPVLSIVSKVDMPEGLFRALKYVPPAVLSAIIFPALFIQDGRFNIQFSNAPLYAGLAAIAIAWRSRNLLLTIIGGMTTLLVWRSLIP
jgi:branched-subunit amino acid transport protein